MLVYHREVELSQTSNPFAFGSNSTEVPLNTTFMTNPGNIPTTALPCMECGGVKVGHLIGIGATYTDSSFSGVWLHFQRVTCKSWDLHWCICVQNTGKKVLY